MDMQIQPKGPVPPQQEKVAFHRTELGVILGLYGRMVASGEWRDYGISCLRDVAIFSIFRRTAEHPIYRIEKRPKLAARQGISDRVRLLDPLPPDALGAWLRTCRVGLAPLTPSERNLVQGCMPVKLLDYMRAGLPVLAPDIAVCRHVLGPEAPTYRAWSRTSLTERLEHLLTSDLRSLSDHLQARVEREFSEDVQQAALEAAYR